MSKNDMKLYCLKTGTDEYGNLIKLVGRLMSVEYLTVELDPNNKKDQEIIAKSFTGKLPMLLLEDQQTYLCESLSIARYFSSDKMNFYGPNPVSKAQVDQWIDIINQQVHPLSVNLTNQVLGYVPSEIKAFSQQCAQFRANLGMFEKYLKLRNFLVGYQMTLADAYFVTVLISPFQLFIDQQTRDKTFPNLNRYMNIHLQGQHYAKSFGKPYFCKKGIQPNFNVVFDKKPKGEEKKDDGKAQKKQTNDKKPTKDAPKKKEEQKAAAPVEKEDVDLLKQWETSLKELKFDFYDFKTEYVNSKDKKATLKKLFTELWDDKALSVWVIHYQKYDDSEGAKVHTCSNMLNGFIQRFEEKLRKHTIGSFGVYGEEGQLEQYACLLMRGPELPYPLTQHVSIEYWTKTKLDVKKEADQEKIFQFWNHKEEEKANGMTVQKYTMYK